MKKLLAFLLAVIMMVSLVACVKPVDPTTTVKPNDGTTSGDNTDNTTTAPVDNEAAKYGGHLNVSIGSTSWSYLDPSKSTGAGNYTWTSMVWEAPLTRDTNGNICPNVCDFELSDDALTLKLWVREGVTFHDGSAVEIEDVVASLQRATHKSPRSYVAAYIKDVVIDGAVATVTFTEYNEKTMYYIACVNPFIGVMPKEVAEKFSYESGNFIDNLDDAIGTGPYKIADYKEGEYVEMVRHEEYVAVPEGHDGFAGPKKAYLDSVTFYFPSDDNIGAMALLNGEYDIGGLPEDYRSQMDSAGLKLVQTGMASSARAIHFNTFGNSLCSNDPNLRKAIVAAIDIPELLNYEKADAYAITGCFPMDGIYQVDTFEKADYMGEDKLDVVKKYLAASNYKGEELQLAVPADQSDEFVAICAYLNAAGINTKMNVMEWNSALEFVADPNNNWDFRLTMDSLNNTPVLLADAIMKNDYKSEAKDALLAELGKLPAGSDAYIAKWHELAQQMVDDCAVICMGRPNSEAIMNKDLNFVVEGPVTYYFNCYWDNPEEHTK